MLRAWVHIGENETPIVGDIVEGEGVGDVVEDFPVLLLLLAQVAIGQETGQGVRISAARFPGTAAPRPGSTRDRKSIGAARTTMAFQPWDKSPCKSGILSGTARLLRRAYPRRRSPNFAGRPRPLPGETSPRYARSMGISPCVGGGPHIRAGSAPWAPAMREPQDRLDREARRGRNRMPQASHRARFPSFAQDRTRPGSPG